MVMIDVADFVKKDISIDKSAVTFYTGTFTNSSRTDNLEWNIFVCRVTRIAF